MTGHGCQDVRMSALNYIHMFCNPVDVCNSDEDLIKTRQLYLLRCEFFFLYFFILLFFSALFRYLSFSIIFPLLIVFFRFLRLFIVFLPSRFLFLLFFFSFSFLFLLSLPFSCSSFFLFSKSYPFLILSFSLRFSLPCPSSSFSFTLS